MKKGFITGILFLALLISACTTEETTTSLQGAYAACYGDDSQTIQAEFDAFAPLSNEESPYQTGEEIDITVRLTNLFTSDIAADKVKLRLSGDAANENIFSGGSGVVEAETPLYGIDTETCLTEGVDVDIGPLVYQNEITTKIQKEIQGLFCYEQPVVVKAYLYYTDNPDLIGETLPAGSNPPSPVQVTQVEQNPVDVDRESGTGELRFKIYLQNLGTGTIVEDLDECFVYREAGYREEISLDVGQAAYDVECPSTVKFSRDEKTDVVSCKVTGIDINNLGSSPSEITITLNGFAYEEAIPPTTIWLEP